MALPTSRKPVLDINQSVHTPRLGLPIGIVSVLAPRKAAQLLRRNSPHTVVFSPLSLPRTIHFNAGVSLRTARHPFLLCSYSLSLFIAITMVQCEKLPIGRWTNSHIAGEKEKYAATEIEWMAWCAIGRRRV